MEAIGLAASIGQLSVLTLSIFNLYRDFKDAPGRAASIRDELASMATLLSGLERVLRDHNKETTAETSASLESAIIGYGRALHEAKSLVEMKQYRGFRRLKTSLAKTKIESLLQTIERYKCTFALVLTLYQE
jgi:hypothetical protein